MVLDLLALAALPTAIGATEAVHQSHVLDSETPSDDRQAPFHLNVYCDAQSRKRAEVHNAIVVLKDGKLRLWPSDPKTNLLKQTNSGDASAPHPFTGFYHDFPTEDLVHQPMLVGSAMGLVSTIPTESSLKSGEPKPSSAKKPKLNWIYVDNATREVKYGPRAIARKHIVGPWDWTEVDRQGLTLSGEESLVAVEEDTGGYGWAIYWDEDDDRLKGYEVGMNKRVLRCSLERQLIDENDTSSEERSTHDY